MDVQLGSQGKAGGGVPACASQPAHTQDKFNGPGPMAVLRHPQQSAQQAPGDVHPSGIRVADTLHVFQDQAAQQHSTADDVLFVGNAGGVGALDVQDAFEAADEIGALEWPGSGARPPGPGEEIPRRRRRMAPAKTKTAPGMGRGLPSRVYSPSCMGARKYFSQPRETPPSSESNSSKKIRGISRLHSAEPDGGRGRAGGPSRTGTGSER